MIKHADTVGNLAHFLWLPDGDMMLECIRFDRWREKCVAAPFGSIGLCDNCGYNIAMLNKGFEYDEAVAFSPKEYYVRRLFHS